MKNLHEASSYLFGALGLTPFWIEREQHRHHSLTSSRERRQSTLQGAICSQRTKTLQLAHTGTELGALISSFVISGHCEYGRQRTRHSLGLHADQTENP